MKVIGLCCLSVYEFIALIRLGLFTQCMSSIRTIWIRILTDQLIYSNNSNDAKDGGVYGFIIFRQPVWKIDIKICLCRIGILTGDHCQWTKEFEGQQGDTFKDKQTISYPKPFVQLICNYRIEHVENNKIEKKPHQCMNRFDKNQF